MDFSPLLSFLQKFFTNERVLWLIMFVIAIALYELTKKATRKAIGYVTERKWKITFILIIIIILLVLFFFPLEGILK